LRIGREERKLGIRREEKRVREGSRDEGEGVGWDRN